MKIDLHNFFKFFDEDNPNHVAAVAQLEAKIERSLLDDNSEWVKTFRTPLSVKQPSKSVALSVPFYPQTDNYVLPHSTCNSSSCAMALEFLKPGSLSGPKGDDAYLKKVLALGKSIDHTVQTKVLESYGLYSTWKTNLEFSDLDRELSLGKPVVIGILHRGPLSNPTGGHIAVCIGRTSDGSSYIFNDPYGSLMDGYTSATESGKGVRYPKSVLKKRWTVDGPGTGWGRIFVK